jgi:hypothetical protein
VASDSKRGVMIFYRRRRREKGTQWMTARRRMG